MKEISGKVRFNRPPKRGASMTIPRGGLKAGGLPLGVHSQEGKIDAMEKQRGQVLDAIVATLKKHAAGTVVTNVAETQGTGNPRQIRLSGEEMLAGELRVRSYARRTSIIFAMPAVDKCKEVQADIHVRDLGVVKEPQIKLLVSKILDLGTLRLGVVESARAAKKKAPRKTTKKAG